MKRDAHQRLVRVRPGPEHPLHLLRYNLRQVELARARGERLEIAWAWPTALDGLLSFMETWKVLEALEALPDRRRSPEVPLLPLLLCCLCRFLMGMNSFREVEAVLFRHREFLLRLGFTVALVEEGAYPSVGKTPCDAECLSEVLREVGWEALREVFVGTVQRWRAAYPKLFRGGQFLVDSTHFQAAMRHEGAEQEQRVQDGEEKICILMLRTPHELIAGGFPGSFGGSRGRRGNDLRASVDRRGDGHLRGRIPQGVGVGSRLSGWRMVSGGGSAVGAAMGDGGPRQHGHFP
ncbi:MAG: hypothetical protein IT210_06085 [Armatimonadetes bacterium]|nr:hypothetical protein [Armatimonadota bacterium]